jgi:Protein of unknown function (DUF2934)
MVARLRPEKLRRWQKTPKRGLRPRFYTRCLSRSALRYGGGGVQAEGVGGGGQREIGPERGTLNAKMHVSRGGQLTPYGDPHGVLAQTKAGLDQVVCERAYLLWEQADRPDGCADDFWHPRFRPPLSLDPPLAIPQLVRALRLVVSRACPSEPSPPLRATAPTQWHRPTPLWGADKQDRADGENTLRGPGRASFEIRRRCRLPPRLAAGTSSSIALPEARAGITQIGFYVLR